VPVADRLEPHREIYQAAGPRTAVVYRRPARPEETSDRFDETTMRLMPIQGSSVGPPERRGPVAVFFGGLSEWRSTASSPA